MKTGNVVDIKIRFNGVEEEADGSRTAIIFCLTRYICFQDHGARN